MSEKVTSVTAEAINFEGIAAALKEAEPTKKASRTEAFNRLLPDVEDAILRNIPHKRILEVLAKNGLKLSAATFKKLLDEARKNQCEIEKIGVPGGGMPPHATGDQIGMKYGQGGAR
ncbi:hypothetical protein [Hydrogenophaga sp.]|uniref:hypothetical protein n=1 Tax=Hydrogenophaga sp. TaxID=1904254 RepID=UPI0035AE0899